MYFEITPEETKAALRTALADDIAYRRKLVPLPVPRQ